MSSYFKCIHEIQLTVRRTRRQTRQRRRDSRSVRQRDFRFCPDGGLPLVIEFRWHPLHTESEKKNFTIFFQLIVLVTVATWRGEAVRVNMQGALSLGKHVVDELSHFLHTSLQQQSRRSMPADVSYGESPQIMWTIQSVPICKGLDICRGPLGQFVKDYVTVHAHAVEGIFDGILYSDTDEKATEAKGAIFSEKLKHTLLAVKKMLQEANDNITEDKEAFVWIHLIKGISAVFQRDAILFVSDRLEGNPKDIQNAKKKLIQKLILANVIVENKFESKLCADYRICAPEYECTKALSNFLDYFRDITEERAKEFIKNFYESLSDDIFYFGDADTANEFQIILSEMSYSETVPAKEILMSVRKTVEIREQCLKTKSAVPKAYDVQLVHIILADMDHFFQSKRDTYPFEGFLNAVSKWLRSGGKLTAAIREVINILKKKLHRQQPDMLNKLTNEVRVFLELTVGPK